MKIVVVTHDSVFGRYFAGTLASLCRIDRVVIETNRASARFYVRKLRRSGVVNFGFQWWLNRWFERQGARVLSPCALPPHERVPSINAITWEDDEWVVAFGTSYVTSQTLALVPHGILNVHTGALPLYRGVKSEFWALHNRDFSNIGWTLHYMTPRLDAGDIVLRNTIEWQRCNPGVLRARLVRDAVPQIASLCTRVRAMDSPSLERVPQGSGQYYTTPTLGEWLAVRSVWA